MYKNDNTVNDHWDWYYDSERANNDQSYDYFTVIFITFFHGIDRVQPCYFYSFPSLTYFPSSATYVLGCKITTKQIINDNPDERQTSREEKWKNAHFLVIPYSNFVIICSPKRWDAKQLTTADNSWQQLTTTYPNWGEVTEPQYLGLENRFHPIIGNVTVGVMMMTEIWDDGDLSEITEISMVFLSSQNRKKAEKMKMWTA